MDTKPSKVKEVEKYEENDQKTYPEPMKPEESEENPNAQEVKKDEESNQKIDGDLAGMYVPKKRLNETCVSVLDTILESLCKISVFTRELPDGLRDFLVDNLPLTHPMEANGVSALFVSLIELLPGWKSGNGVETLNSHFELLENAEKICSRCKTDTEYPVQHAYGLIASSSLLREIKPTFPDFTFSKILKVTRISVKLPCGKEDCEKQHYVQRMINELPSVFTVALEWENNETEEEIYATTSVLGTEIDIGEIYIYKGHCPLTKYHLVSMVCLCGDGYKCIAYENKRWVSHFGSKKEVIGDWKNVLRVFKAESIRPVILFFEKVMWGNQILFGSLG